MTSINNINSNLMNIEIIQTKLLNELTLESLKQIIDNQNSSHYIPIILQAVGMVLGMRSPSIKSINVMLSKKSIIKKILNATQNEIIGRSLLTKNRKQYIRSWMEYRPETFGQIMGYKGKYPLVYTLRNWCMIMTNYQKNNNLNIQTNKQYINYHNNNNNNNNNNNKQNILIITNDNQTQCNNLEINNNEYCCTDHRSQTKIYYKKVKKMLEKVKQFNENTKNRTENLEKYKLKIIEIKNNFELLKKQSILKRKTIINERIKRALTPSIEINNISDISAISNIEQTLQLNKKSSNLNENKSYNTLEILRDIRELMEIDEELRESNAKILKNESELIRRLSEASIISINKEDNGSEFAVYSDGLEEEWENERKEIIKRFSLKHATPLVGYVMGEENDEQDIKAFELVNNALNQQNNQTKESVALWVDFSA